MVSKNEDLSCVDDYEARAREMLSEEVIDYIFRGTESQTTLRRNTEAFARYALRLRVLLNSRTVDTSCSYFGGAIRSSLPFFPGPINVGPMYPNALRDVLRVANQYQTPIFVSHLAYTDSLTVLDLPKLVPRTSPLVWQIYLQQSNVDYIFKQARQAKGWGYKALALTVDLYMNAKLGNEIPNVLSMKFLNTTTKDIEKLCKASPLPVIVKGLMTPEDAESAVESGAEGIVVSNHGGRVLDQGEASLDVLPEIVRHLGSKKKTRRTEVFFDSGIRRGTDILKALALGARGCLIGRPIAYGLAVDRENGPSDIMRILKEELVRAGTLCGVSKLSEVDLSILRPVYSVR